MSALAAPRRPPAGRRPAASRPRNGRRSRPPATGRDDGPRYLQRLATLLAPRSMNAAANALRRFARWMITDTGAGSSPTSP